MIRKPLMALRRLSLLQRIPKRLFCSSKPGRDGRPSTGFDPMRPDNLNNREPFEFPEEGPEKNEQSNIMIYFFLFCGGALAVLYVVQKMNRMKQESLQKSKAKTKSFGKADIGKDWELVDVNGTVYSSKALKGQYYIIYFGFGKCPDICPNSLRKLAEAKKKVTAKGGVFSKLNFVFVSVDPDRDSPEDIKRFLSNFDETMLGVTGKTNDDPALKKMLKDFRIYSTKIDMTRTEPDGTVVKDYSLDHSVLSYLMSPTNEYITHLGSSLTSRDLVDTIVEGIQSFEDSQL